MTACGSRTALRTVSQHVRHARLIHGSQLARADLKGESSTTKSGRRMRSERDLEGRTVDLVGPPDPLSNIRPVLYAEMPSSRTRRQTTHDKATNHAHPYSVNEFSQQGSSSGRANKGRKLGTFEAFRRYVDRISDSVEEEEMKLRLSRLSTDVTTQRFWRDNNARFTRDLHSWQQQHEGQDDEIAPPAASAEDSTTLAKRDQNRDLIAGLSNESDFYATWLRANAKRNRAYNILVWRQAFDQVRQGARVTVLQTWLSLLRRFN